jgi:hypothetical protein
MACVVGVLFVTYILYRFSLCVAFILVENGGICYPFRNPLCIRDFMLLFVIPSKIALQVHCNLRVECCREIYFSLCRQNGCKVVFEGSCKVP